MQFLRLVTLLALLLPAALQAQITLTVAATAGTSSLGFTEGQAVTFSITTAAGFASTGSSTFSATLGDAWNQTTGGASLVTAMTLPGTLGSFGGASTLGGDSPAKLQVGHYTDDFDVPIADMLHLSVGDDSGLGFTTVSYLGPASFADPFTIVLRTVPIKSVQLDFALPLGTYSFLGGYAEPTSYFTNYLGTYTPDPTGFTAFLLYGDMPNVTADGINYPSFASFTVTSLTLATAIPESSTYAMLVGLGSLGFTWLHRRRSRVRS